MRWSCSCSSSSTPSSPSSSATSTPSTALLQAQFGEDADQHHDGHHSADDVDDEVCAVPLLVLLPFCDGCHGLAGVGPDGRVVVGADALVQPLLAELAAESVEAGAAAVEEDAGVAVERWVPLTHHIIVTLATCPARWRAILIVCVPTAYGGGQPRLQRGVLGGLHIVRSRLVGHGGGNHDGVAFGYCHGGDRRVLGEGRLSDEEGGAEEEEKVVGGRVGDCHAAGRALLSNVPPAGFEQQEDKFGDRVSETEDPFIRSTNTTCRLRSLFRKLHAAATASPEQTNSDSYRD